MTASHIDQIREILLTVPGLQSFCIAAIVREMDSRIVQWQQVTRDLVDSMPSMPPLLQDIDTDLEWTYAMSLITAFGGQQLYIPQGISSNHPLAAQLGIDAATWACKRWGSLMIIVPKVEELLRLARDKAMLEDIKAGMTTNQLAQKHDLAYQNASALKGRLKDVVQEEEAIAVAPKAPAREMMRIDDIPSPPLHSKKRAKAAR